jgi:hypothetical protein
VIARRMIRIAITPAAYAAIAATLALGTVAVEPQTNAIAGYYFNFKRGIKGVCQHCGEKHLHRYVAEFDFRYSNRSKLGVEDLERTSVALKGVIGRRLLYRNSSGAAA